MTRFRRTAALVAVLLIAAGCGTGDGEGATTTESASPTTTGGGSTTAEDVSTTADTAQATTTEAASEGDSAVGTSLLDITPDSLPEGWDVPQTMGHVTNYLVHEWYQNLTAAEEAEAAEFGIEFDINDANLDLQTSLAGLDDYLASDVDVIAFTPVDEAASATSVSAAAESVPIVCEASPTEGCSTLVAIDDYQAGVNVGEWAGNYLQEQGITDVKVLDIGLPALSTTVARSQGFWDALTGVIPDAERVEVDGQGLKDEAVRVAADALTANQDINVIFGINDDSALGGLEAFRAAGLDESNLLVVGFGCEGEACKSALEADGPYQVSAAMFPEFIGALMIRAGIAVHNGQELPEKVVTPSTPMTPENLADFYTKQDGGYTLNFEAVADLYDG